MNNTGIATPLILFIRNSVYSDSPSSKPTYSTDSYQCMSYYTTCFSFIRCKAITSSTVTCYHFWLLWWRCCVWFNFRYGLESTPINCGTPIQLFSFLFYSHHNIAICEKTNPLLHRYITDVSQTMLTIQGFPLSGCCFLECSSSILDCCLLEYGYRWDGTVITFN